LGRSFSSFAARSRCTSGVYRFAPRPFFEPAFRSSPQALLSLFPLCTLRTSHLPFLYIPPLPPIRVDTADRPSPTFCSSSAALLLDLDVEAVYLIASSLYSHWNASFDRVLYSCMISAPLSSFSTSAAGPLLFFVEPELLCVCLFLFSIFVFFFFFFLLSSSGLTWRYPIKVAYRSLLGPAPPFLPPTCPKFCRHGVSL